MKIPKFKYVACTNRCPRQTACRYKHICRKTYNCTLKTYANKMDHVHNLIKILEVGDENTQT